MQSIADAFATRNERQHRKELSFDPFGEYTVLGAAEWNRLVAAGGLGQETGPTARSSTEDRPPAPGLVPTGEHRSRPRALHSAYSDVERLDVFTEEGHAVMIEPGRVMGQDGPDRVVSAYEREGIRGRGDVIEPLAMRHFGDVERGTDEEGRDANDTLIHDLLDRPGVAMVSAVPRDDNASILDVQTNARPPQPIYVIEMDPDMYDADYYTLELTGSAMVSHEALFDDGSQTAYSIPVLHYRQVSVLDDEDYDDD